MNTNFAQRAKEIVAKHGKDKKSALAELDQLRREQFNYEQQYANGGKVNIGKELERGVEVEKEHAPTLQFVKDYVAQTGEFPDVDKFAKSIMVDHEKDFKKLSDNPERSYYKSLINNGLSDEVARYAEGGSMKPLNIPNEELETLRLMANGGMIPNMYEQGSRIMAGNRCANIPADAFNPMRMNTVNNRASGGDIMNSGPDGVTYGDGGVIAKSDTVRVNLPQVNVAAKAATLQELRNKYGDYGLTSDQRVAMRRAENVERKIRETNKKSVGGPIRYDELFNMGSTLYANGGNMYFGGGTDSEEPVLTAPDRKLNPWAGAYGQGVTIPQDSINSYVSKYFKPEDQQRMLDIIKRESAGTNAFRDKSKNPGGGNDWGLTQINDKWHPNYFDGTHDMTNPEENIKAASKIAYGSKNGWSAWNASSKYSPSATPKPFNSTPSRESMTPVVPYSHPMETIPELMKSSADRYNARPIAGLQKPIYAPQPDGVVPKGTDWNNMMRYAPIAANLISGLSAKKGQPLNENVNLPTIAPTLISPEQLSTMPMQEQVGSQYRSALDALKGASGGSGANIRAGMIGTALAGSRGAGEAYNDIYSKNAMMRSDATKYNANATDAVNRINLDQQNKGIQMSRENKIANQQDLAARDMKRNDALMAAASGLGKIGKENKESETLKTIYKYDQFGNKINWADDAKKKVAPTTTSDASSLKRAERYLKRNPNRASITTLNPQSTLIEKKYQSGKGAHGA